MGCQVVLMRKEEVGDPAVLRRQIDGADLREHRPGDPLE